MSLDFTGATSDRVEVGSGSAIDNLDPFAGFAWIWLEGSGNRFLWGSEDDTSGGARQIRINVDGFVQAAILRATSNVVAEGARAIGTGKWAFVAWSLDSSGATGDQQVFDGDLNTVVSEPTYTTQTAGSGTVKTDATKNKIIGNWHGTSLAFDRDIAVMAVFNRTLSLAELRALQFRPRPISGCVGFWRLGDNGTGSQQDLSGNGNTGTVTGAALAPNVPLGHPFAYAGSPAITYPSIVTLSNDRLADMAFCRGRLPFGPGRLPAPDGAIS